MSLSMTKEEVEELILDTYFLLVLANDQKTQQKHKENLDFLFQVYEEEFK